MLTVHTNPEKLPTEYKVFRKRSDLQTSEIENAGSAFYWGRKNILKTEFFENNDVTIIMWLTLPIKGDQGYT